MPTKKITKKDWVLTDGDTGQYGRQVSEHVFEFKERGREQTAIDLREYSKEQIEDAISPFGYSLADNPSKGEQNIFVLYGEQANWIIAECLFEFSAKPTL